VFAIYITIRIVLLIVALVVAVIYIGYEIWK